MERRRATFRFLGHERCVEEETLLRVSKEKNARANETYLSLSLSLFFFLGREDVKVFKACACECESTRVFLQIFLNARDDEFLFRASVSRGERTLTVPLWCYKKE